jgi:ribosomal protein S4E
VNKYYDNSNIVIKRINDENEYKQFKFKKDITIRDILILTSRIGSNGFFLDNKQTQLIDIIRNMITTENLKKDIMISAYNYIHVVSFEFIPVKGYNGHTVSLSRIDCWDN